MGKYDELQSRYKSKTKAELVEMLCKQELAFWELQDKYKALGKGYLAMTDRSLKLEEQRDEWEHLAESVIDGVRQTLNNDTKLYDKHHNTYYALWYWVEWGSKVNKEMKAESNNGGDK